MDLSGMSASMSRCNRIPNRRAGTIHQSSHPVIPGYKCDGLTHAISLVADVALGQIRSSGDFDSMSGLPECPPITFSGLCSHSKQMTAASAGSGYPASIAFQAKL